MSPSIGIVFITYNQSTLLEESLKRISQIKHQVYIFDLGSTEDIQAVASKYGAVYKRLPYTDIVETVRAKIFAQVPTDYILYLDSDESVSPELVSQLADLTSSGLDYARLPRQNFIFGTWVRASRWWPDYQVRFFKNEAVTWPSVLHEQPVATGVGVTLPEDPERSIQHHNYQNMDEWIDKNRRYARIDAASRLASQKPFTIIDASALSVSELVSRYYSGHGYRDGMHGLLLSILQSFYYFLVYAYYWEANKHKSKESDQALRTMPRLWFSHGLSEILFWDNGTINTTQKIKSKIIRRLIK